MHLLEVPQQRYRANSIDCLSTVTGGHSSSGRLHASPKVSFSSIVQHTMKCKAMGGMGSGRCLSSASPISAVERQQLWGSSMHHSFDDRPTASSDDLFASCNDIDQAVSYFLKVTRFVASIIRARR
ncbi:unnamed protein product [Caenorhabditis angaria]|uniref:Uncharacterized protein n=1 Tax=Caenorhabditis angaria TaxID=860376 RepID=A0A9P1I528_9PELO|nr:unnamed protein product [Caenorhabditis angaria]